VEGVFVPRAGGSAPNTNSTNGEQMESKDSPQTCTFTYSVGGMLLTYRDGGGNAGPTQQFSYGALPPPGARGGGFLTCRPADPPADEADADRPFVVDRPPDEQPSQDRQRP
jgi:hypothetical protein